LLAPGMGLQSTRRTEEAEPRGPASC
jgi:hypothetical protein